MVFDENWFRAHQKTLLSFLNSPVTKRWLRRIFYIKNTKFITEIGPSYFTVRGGNSGEYISEFLTWNQYSHIIYKVFYPLWKLYHIWDQITSFAPSLNLGFDSLIIRPDGSSGYYASGTSTTSGYVEHNAAGGATFSTIRSGAGTAAYDKDDLTQIGLVRLVAHTTHTNYFTFMDRTIFIFNTSSIGSATVSAATLTVLPTSTYSKSDLGDTTLVITSAAPASMADLVATDYSLTTPSAHFGTTSFASTAISALTFNTFNDFSLNASGISALNKTGLTGYGIRLGWDFNNSFTGTWFSGKSTSVSIFASNWSGVLFYYASCPKLVVTYSLAVSASTTIGTILSTTF